MRVATLVYMHSPVPGLSRDSGWLELKSWGTGTKSGQTYQQTNHGGIIYFAISNVKRYDNIFKKPNDLIVEFSSVFS